MLTAQRVHRSPGTDTKAGVGRHHRRVRTPYQAVKEIESVSVKETVSQGETANLTIASLSEISRMLKVFQSPGISSKNLGRN